VKEVRDPWLSAREEEREGISVRARAGSGNGPSEGDWAQGLAGVFFSFFLFYFPKPFQKDVLNANKFTQKKQQA